MAASNCLSALSLVDNGRELVIRKNLFPSFFSLFHEPNSIPFPEKFSMMGDMPTLFGSNLEELLRHHPPLMRPCVRAMVGELKRIASLVDHCEGLTLDASYTCPESGKVYRYTSLLHAATSALHCLEGLLLKVEHVKEFLLAGGVGSLLHILHVALGPPRYFLSSLACCVETTLLALGYYPIVKTLSRVFQTLAQHEPKMFMNRILIALDSQLTTLSKQLLRQEGEKKEKKKEKEEEEEAEGDGKRQGCSDEGEFLHSKQFPLHHWLELLSREPLHHHTANGELTPTLLECTKSLQSFVTLDYLVDALSLVVHALAADPRQRPALAQLAEPRNMKVLSRLVDEVYVGSQMEVSRARGQLRGIVHVSERATTKDHPVYKVLVVAQDSVTVRENQTDISSKKVCKLEKGAVFYADARSLGVNNMLQYHVFATDNGGGQGAGDTHMQVSPAVTGWVNSHRNVNSVDPQIEVIDVLSVSPTPTPSGTAVRFDKLANVSPHKAGFMGLFHLHGCLRHLLSALAWSCSPCTDHPAFSRLTQQVMPPQTHKLVPLVANCLLRLLPAPLEQKEADKDTNEKRKSDQPGKPPRKQRTAAVTTNKAKKSKKKQKGVEDVPALPMSGSSDSLPTSTSSSSFSSADMLVGGKVADHFFVSRYAAPPSSAGAGAGAGVSGDGSDASVGASACPSLEEFSTAHAFRTVYVVELCHYLLFEDKKGTRSEPNMIMLVHLFYNGFLERLAQCTSLVFLSCLDPKVPAWLDSPPPELW